MKRLYMGETTSNTHMQVFRQAQGVMSRLEERAHADDIALDGVKEDFLVMCWTDTMREGSAVRLYLVAMSREILIVLNRQ